ncbi:MULTISPECIES: phosphate signaling complex protein PhoU [Haloarcula]|uniref:Phosphate-specific transport system accessory protein PhoU n=1 Tax=Haloarcula pellucida TaxID=1427151 RepID=A0A830GPJ2_9EURY|nr:MULTISPECIES: phosphate signaling complex protein PhoU [Halomicroarcula]MBX0348213.1 phosphate signaling complex protein PhoU [Halomicroarcula pellucida]MDS0278067.1 phosphate signaling complex protein PhoU [Halomicroarcula sp. S1AR25-4]GGN97519.1 phosphate transport system regulatory protein PhoU [Halomicroarcula pellucida]
MTRDTFESELDALRADVCAMGADVTDRLDRAVTAYERRDPGMGRAVAEADDEINQSYLDLEQDCIDLIALQQPVASDLRFIAASFKILTDLERIADLAANLGGYVDAMESDTIPNVPIADIADMVLAQLDGAMAAYEDADADRCREVAAADTDVDQRCGAATDDLVRTLVNHSPAEDDTEALLADTKRYLLTVRDLERVGDHAVNVAARTLYMVESSDDLIY